MIRIAVPQPFGSTFGRTFGLAFAAIFGNCPSLARHVYDVCNLLRLVVGSSVIYALKKHPAPQEEAASLFLMFRKLVLLCLWRISKFANRVRHGGISCHGGVHERQGRCLHRDAHHNHRRVQGAIEGWFFTRLQMIDYGIFLVEVNRTPKKAKW